MQAAFKEHLPKCHLCPAQCDVSLCPFSLQLSGPLCTLNCIKGAPQFQKHLQVTACHR